MALSRLPPATLRQMTMREIEATIGYIEKMQGV